MTPDTAAKLLQIPERGIELLQRFEEDENIRKAISAVQQGFAPADVARMYELEWDEEEVEEEKPEEHDPEGTIHVYECTTKRCRQKGRVATSSVGPDPEWGDPEEVQPPPSCPSCGTMMHYVMTVSHESDINHLKRTYLPKARMHDDMHGVDRSGDRADAGDDDE